MNFYLQLTILAAIVVFVVDLSGFTDYWRNALARLLKLRPGQQLRPLKPFDCSLCMTWWSCLLYSLCVGHFDLPAIGASAALAFLSSPISTILLFIREWILWLFNQLMPR